jgi:hypothetical protein
MNPSLLSSHLIFTKPAEAKKRKASENDEVEEKIKKPVKRNKQKRTTEKVCYREVR